MPERQLSDPAEAARVDALFEQLLTIDREAYERKDHNVAYHALSAALHVAHDSGDERKIGVVERMAREQLETIDSRQPEYQHSTENARHRGQVSVFANLAKQAQTMARMNRSRRAYERVSALPGAERGSAG